MCYDTTKWEDARDAIIKSALTTPKYCGKADSLESQIHNLLIPEIPAFIKHPLKENEVI
jgi:hypothetical protein